MKLGTASRKELLRCDRFVGTFWACNPQSAFLLCTEQRFGVVDFPLSRLSLKHFQHCEYSRDENSRYSWTVFERERVRYHSLQKRLYAADILHRHSISVLDWPPPAILASELSSSFSLSYEFRKIWEIP